MASNYIQPGKTLTLVAPYQRDTGLGALVGSIFGVALQTVANAVAGEFAVAGVWELTKVGSQAWTQGAKIYWDDGNKRCTTDSSAGPLIGTATAAVASGAGDVLGTVRLDGSAHQIGSLGGSIIPSATVAAAGSVQGDAAAVATGFTLVSAADGTKGVLLPAAAAGKVVIIKNNVAAALKVWPASGDAINAIAANAALSMASLTSAVFTAYDATTWYTSPLVPS